MGRQLKKDQLSKLYRQFSRQRYTKYKHQFPRMRESQLVSKIIKEWEALNIQDKAKLYKHFEEHEGLPDDKSDSSNQKSDKKIISDLSRTPISKLRQKSRTPVKKESTVKIYRGDKSEQKLLSESSDFPRQQEGNIVLSQSDSKGEIGVSKVKKTIKINKQSRKNKTQYLKFFDFYYAKLHAEHPTWRPNQISTIIKLLWKKKIIQKKKTKSNFKTPRQPKPCSGKVAFRKAYGYDAVLTKTRWLQLTKQARNYWNLKGQGKKSGQKRIIATTLRLKSFSRRKTNEQICVRPTIVSFINKPVSVGLNQ